jgi:hypothetical protein
MTNGNVVVDKTKSAGGVFSQSAGLSALEGSAYRIGDRVAEDFVMTDSQRRIH